MAEQHAAVRAVLVDTFDRITELVESVTDNLSSATAAYRPDPEANSVGWLLWHLSRVQDNQVAGLLGTEEVWTAQQWDRKFDLPLDASDTGYGHSSEQVGEVRASGDLLRRYHRAVADVTAGYLDGVTDAELDRIVDEQWDPPVTAAVRLVSTFADCLQHCGQASYVRGLAERASG